MFQISKRLALIVCLFIVPSMSEIRIESPKSLKTKISKKNGLIDYSVSTFGFLDYQAKIDMQVKKWNSEDGCNEPSKELLDKNGAPVAFIMYRGGCTYIKKAENVRKAGGKVAVVILNYLNGDPANVIPISAEKRK